jgi:hypothetical protein
VIAFFHGTITSPIQTEARKKIPLGLRSRRVEGGGGFGDLASSQPVIYPLGLKRCISLLGLSKNIFKEQQGLFRAFVGGFLCLQVVLGLRRVINS